MSSPLAILRRYDWNRLTEPEKEAIRDCAQIAGLRVSTGVLGVMTVMALIGQGWLNQQ